MTIFSSKLKQKLIKLRSNFQIISRVISYTRYYDQEITPSDFLRYFYDFENDKMLIHIYDDDGCMLLKRMLLI